MPSPLDGALRQAAKVAIGRLGKPVTLRRTRGGTYDSATDTVPVEPAEVQVKAIVGAYASLTGRSALSALDGVERGDLRVQVPAKDIPAAFAAPLNEEPPRLADEVVIDGATYRVVGLDPVYSGEQVAVWSLQVRR